MIETACYALAVVSAANLTLALAVLALAHRTANSERRAMVKQLTRID